MKAVGDYLRTLRDLRDFTQQEVADAANISDRTVGNWEKGERAPTMPSFKSVLDKLQGDWDDVLYLMRWGGDGVALAKRRFTEGVGLTDEERRSLSRLNPAQRLAVRELLRQMTDTDQ